MYRTDFVSFVGKCFHLVRPGVQFQMNHHIEAMGYELERVRCGENRRLIINLPPRSLKSLVCSVAWPAYILGHDPSKNIVVSSYNSDLAIKLSNDCRAVMSSNVYQCIFPWTKISRAKNSEFEFTTTRQGFRLATSIHGTLTGRGGDILIIDDPMKPIDALSDKRRKRVNHLFKNTVRSRLDDQRKGAVVIVMQRLHPEDLVGMLLRESDGWTVLSLPAIAEQPQRVQIGPDKYHLRQVGDPLHAERAPASELERLRVELGPEIFAAHYQQAPDRPGGGLIQRDSILRYERLPAPGPSTRILQSWDTASMQGEQNDWSVCTTWMIHEKKYYLMDELRGRFDYPTLKAQAIAHARAYKTHAILVENAGVGTALIAELRNAGLSAVAVKPNKVVRMSIQAAKFASGRVLFPQHASWLAVLEAELFAFPHGRHDDQVDSIAQALTYEHPTYDPGTIAKGLSNMIAEFWWRDRLASHIASGGR
jgi:predicted phage terminase large subunit-like protein